MMGETHAKVQARHLKRNAYLYVRQSTLRQVLENTESTKRQYDLRERAMALGWPLDQVIVIDSDLGQSGASAVDREGFQQLVSEVGLGRAGIVMGLEVSRLARNSTDWHRLLEICALADTLILDEDGVYDPAHFNDRLLLGLKGTMSEAELHVLRARLRGGILNKARRGELEIRLPIGFDYDPAGRVRLDPDLRVQESLRQFFRTFRRTGSATATVKAFRAEGLSFPHRIYRGPQTGELLWSELDHSRALWLLHHPRYTGAFCFGRTRVRKLPNGSCKHQRLPTEEWIALIRDAHPGYITWDEYEQNLQILRDNAQGPAAGRDRGPPREGPALLQGLVICARCGDRMTVRYHLQGARRVPDYVCQHHGVAHAEPLCQQIVGGELDAAIGRLLVEAVTPVTLEVALAVQKELESRSEESDRLRRQAVERARYESDLARRRYMRCDPDNRLVADSLEAEWNQALRNQTAAQEHYDKQRESETGLDDQQRAAILALAKDFPRLWNDPHTADRERKRMARLLIADVTLLKETEVRAQVRFHGGATHTLHLPPPKPAWLLRQTPAKVVAEIDRLLEDHTDGAIAALLNRQGLLSGEGKPLHRLMVRHIRMAYALPSRHDRLLTRGLLTLHEMAQRLNICPDSLKRWRRAGLLKAHKYDDRGGYLFEPPGPGTPIKHQHQGKTTGKSTTREGSYPAHTV
ncbi:MAG TPA: recombinase family protein [Thauera sp.]|nr:recombinase family protein [Thauera sp.]